LGADEALAEAAVSLLVSMLVKVMVSLTESASVLLWASPSVLVLD
jgi:hypothetical protein